MGSLQLDTSRTFDAAWFPLAFPACRSGRPSAGASRYHPPVPVSRRLLSSLVAALVVVAAGVYYTWFRVDRTPITVAAAVPEDWTLTISDGTDPWVAGVTPPTSLVTRLVAQVRARAGAALVVPAHPAIPLVLRAEFDESLQGAFDIGAVRRMAADLGLDQMGAFEPVCLAHRTVRGAEGRADLYFVPFTSAGFNQFRVQLMPEHPEQAGIGIYDPSILTPVLVVGATEDRFADWWPLGVNTDRDCEAPIAPTR